MGPGKQELGPGLAPGSAMALDKSFSCSVPWFSPCQHEAWCPLQEFQRAVSLSRSHGHSGQRQFLLCFRACREWGPRVRL